MTPIDDKAFDEQIKIALPDALPPSVEKRLQSQLAGFRARLSGSNIGVDSSARREARPVWRLLGALCTAAAVLAAVVALSLRPQIGFAQVAAAVLEKPWVHARTVEGGSQIGEMWYSPGKRVCGWRLPGAMKYEDYRLEVYHSYDSKENVLYRLPIFSTRQAGDFEAMADAMAAIVHREQVPDRPLEQLGFLGLERNKIKVLEQGMTKVNEGGRVWLDYRLAVSHEGSAKPLQFLFRVDSVTKLPAICRISGEENGKPSQSETRFDYPERGPADIYDLGVPRTTKLVDRVPPDDLHRILETIRAGRERMDDYRAVVVHQRGNELPPHENFPWWALAPQILYRKGDMLRTDLGTSGYKIDLELKRPADPDLRRWSLARTKVFRYFTEYVQRDSVLHSSESKNITDRDGSQHFDIVSVQGCRFSAKPGEAVAPDMVFRPDFVCRPPMRIGDPHYEATLEMHPGEGPAGCILVRVGRTTKSGHVNEKVDAYRFWVDPVRDYIVVRWDMVARGPNGNEKITDSYHVEESARSPQGVWYATRVRRKCASLSNPGKQDEEIYHMFVDFDVDLPDEFFKPQVAGRVY
jgi:hypothetical protein